MLNIDQSHFNSRSNVLLLFHILVNMKTTIAIQNLKCEGCGNTITKNLEDINDVSDISIEVENGTVSFNYNNNETIDLVHKTLSKLGYPIAGDDNTLGAKAKSYVSCAIGRMNK